jgi:hypothetical protein
MSVLLQLWSRFMVEANFAENIFDLLHNTLLSQNWRLRWLSNALNVYGLDEWSNDIYMHSIRSSVITKAFAKYKSKTTTFLK